MSWKKGFLSLLLIFAWGITACHAVDENESQISLAKPVEKFLGKAQAQAHSVIPAIPLAKSLPSQPFWPMPEYWLQFNNPAYLTNFAHPDAGCKWLGVAGQVFDPQGTPMPNITVSVTGTLNGTAVSQLGMTGTTRMYGPAGYEILLGNQAVDSQGTLAVQLLDAKSKPISTVVRINTYQDCQKNLVLVNFINVPVSTQHNYVLPLVFNDSALN